MRTKKAWTVGFLVVLIAGILFTLLIVSNGGGFTATGNTLAGVESRITSILNQAPRTDVWTASEVQKLLGLVYVLVILILVAPYLVLLLTTNMFERMNTVRNGIEKLRSDEDFRLPPVRGELNKIVETINELAGTSNYFASYNRYLLDTIQDGVLAVNSDLVVLSANREFLSIFRLSKAQVLNTSVPRFLDGGVPDLIRAAVDSETPYREQTVSWSDKTLQVYSDRIVNGRNELIGYLFVFRDITLVSQYEEALRQRDRLAVLGQMALGVVHEMKNPLTSVQGFIQLMKRTEPEPEVRQRYITAVQQDLTRIDRILNDMLDYGGNRTVSYSAEDLSSLLSTFTAEMAELHPDINIDLQLMGTDFQFEFDPFKIRQVLLNLMSNSIDSGTPGVHVSIRETPEWITVIFEDHGCGIAPENLERVFTPFFSTKPDGSGFGMPVCQKIVEAHHGTIAITSSPDLYTRVTIRLPRERPLSRTGINATNTPRS